MKTANGMKLAQQNNYITMKLKDYFNFNEVLGYYFRKKDPNRPSNINIKMMHWSNKISIIGLIIGIIVILYKNFF